MTILSEDEIMIQMYERLAADGWEPEPLPLVTLVSDSKRFRREATQLHLLPQGESISVRVLDSGAPVLAVNGLDPRRLNALLDVMGILPISDEWMAWYRESLWEGSIAPS